MTQTTISLGFHTALLEDQVGELSEALSKLDFADEIVGELGCLSANVLLSEWRSTVGADGIANVVTTLRLGTRFDDIMSALRTGERHKILHSLTMSPREDATSSGELSI